jgi:hypothetical protein
MQFDAPNKSAEESLIGLLCEVGADWGVWARMPHECKLNQFLVGMNGDFNVKNQI